MALINNLKAYFLGRGGGGATTSGDEHAALELCEGLS